MLEPVLDYNVNKDLYRASIKKVRKGRGRRADRGYEDLSRRLTDPAQVTGRLLFWDQDTWEWFLTSLNDAASGELPNTADLYLAYENEWSTIQEDWARWPEHYRVLWNELKGWCLEAGLDPVPVDLSDGNDRERVRALERVQRKRRGLGGDDFAPGSAETLGESWKGVLGDVLRPDKEGPALDPSREAELLRAHLALNLDQRVLLDVEWGAACENASFSWPWDIEHPSAVRDSGLLGMVVAVMNGRGELKTGQKLARSSNPAAVIQRTEHTWLIVFDRALLVIQKTEMTGWDIIHTFDYPAVQVPDPERAEAHLELRHPDTGEEIISLPMRRLRQPLIEALLDAKSRMENSP